MAVGALSTLALRPARAKTDEREGHGEARRPELAAWLSALSFAGLGRPVGRAPGLGARGGETPPGPGFDSSTTAVNAPAGRPRHPS